jgi:hypothetical protein
MNENSPFVNNITNPQNVPQARPKENLWGFVFIYGKILTQFFYKALWEG